MKFYEIFYWSDSLLVLSWTKLLKKEFDIFDWPKLKAVEMCWNKK